MYYALSLNVDAGRGFTRNFLMKRRIRLNREFRKMYYWWSYEVGAMFDVESLI